jgi:toxin ParE1/3/4
VVTDARGNGRASGGAALRRVPEFDRGDIREVIKRGYRIMYRVSDERIEIVAVIEGHRQVSADILLR